MEEYTNISKSLLTFSLRKEGDFIIPPGEKAKLPKDHPHIRTLVARGYLAKSKVSETQKTNEK